MTASSSANPSQDPLVGRTLQERYRVVRRIGEGGMGAVYEGEHLMIGNKVAIKVLHAKHADDPGIVDRFKREAQATTHIRHHNIVGMFDLGQLEDGSLYLVMEHLEGRDWSSDLSKEGPQPIAKVVHIFSQLCDALGAAHEAGIVHRDIKPDNIFLVHRSGDPNFVKVLDFGISKIREGASALAPSKTQTGTAMGTPYYMAPEQVQGRKDIDARTDIYAMGVVLFQALTGQYPFDGETYPMLVMSIVTQPVPPLSSYRPDLPFELQRVLERMVAKERSQRYESVYEVKAALAPFARIADQPGRVVGPMGRPSTPGVPLQSEVRVAESRPAEAFKGAGPKVLLMIGAVAFLVFAGAVTGGLVAFWPAGESSAEPTELESPSVSLEDVSAETRTPGSAEDVSAETPAPASGQDVSAETRAETPPTVAADAVEASEPADATELAATETTAEPDEEAEAPEARARAEAQAAEARQERARTRRRRERQVPEPTARPLAPPTSRPVRGGSNGSNGAPVLR